MPYDPANYVQIQRPAAASYYPSRRYLNSPQGDMQLTQIHNSGT